MKDDPGSSRSQIVRRVKERVTAADDSRQLEDCRQLTVQGDICTGSRLDLVIWSKDQASIHLVELTVPFETTMEDAVTRERARYSELLQECSRTAKVATLITIEVGSRSFLNLESFQDLYIRSWKHH